MTTPPRTTGFRFSLRDAGVLLAAVAGTVWLKREGHPFWWVVPMVAGHFFLFCNVFMLWRRWEFAWAALLLLNLFLHLFLSAPGPGSVLLWQTPVTLLFLVLQMRSPWYHGVCARHLNLRLEDYLNHRL